MSAMVDVDPQYLLRARSAPPGIQTVTPSMDNGVSQLISMQIN